MAAFKILIFVLTCYFLKSSAQIPDRNIIDYFVGTSMYDLISTETFVKQKMSNFILLVKICANNLKSLNTLKNFVSLLEKFSTKVIEVQTMNDHTYTYVLLENFSDYQYTQIYISKLFSDVKHLEMVRNNFRENCTMLYDFKEDFQAQYLKNWITFSKIPSKNKLIIQVIQEFLKLFTTLSSYLQLLNIHINNYLKLNSYLSDLTVTNAITMPTNLNLDPLLTNLKTMLHKLIPIQQQLITLSKVALNKISIAEKYRTNNQTLDFQGLKSVLETVCTANDYPLLGWLQLYDLNGRNEESKQILYDICSYEQRNYENIKKIVNGNKTLIYFHRYMLAEGSKKVETIQVVNDVVSSVVIVENMLDDYLGQLETSIKQIKLLQNTLKYPCGTFLPYNPLIDPQAPANIGFYVGTHFDKSAMYLGRAPNSNYYSLIPCLARIKINGSNSGAFLPQARGEFFVSKNIEFLLDHPKLIWIKASRGTSPSNLKSIKFSSGKYPVSIGRQDQGKHMLMGQIYHHRGSSDLWLVRSANSLEEKVGNSETFEALGCAA